MSRARGVEGEQVLPVFGPSRMDDGSPRCTAWTTKQVPCARPGTLWAEGRGTLCKQHYAFWCEGRLS